VTTSVCRARAAMLVSALTLVDQFVWTPHIELVARFERAR
jgi:hypothetical protein